MLLYYIMVAIKLYTRVGNYDCIIMCNIGGLYLDRSLRERGGLRSPSPNPASSHEAKKKKRPGLSTSSPSSTYRFRNLRKWKTSIKNSKPYIKCVTPLLCGPWAHLWPFYGLYCKRFSLSIKIYQGWGFQRSGPVSSQLIKIWKTSLKEVTFWCQLTRVVWASTGNGSSLSGVLCLIVKLVLS